MKSIFAVFFMLLSLNVAAESISHRINDEAFESYYLSPDANAPLVILLHDWDGVTDYEKWRAEKLYQLGYAVFVPDLYGAGIRPEAIPDRQAQTAKLYRDRQRMRTLIEGGIEKAKMLGANTENAVLIGYCFGGTAALEMARSGLDMQGFVAIHGGLGTPADQDYKQVKSEILVQHGAADAKISMADFAALGIAMERDKVDHEMIAYGGAGHSFSKPGNDKYNAKADAESWARLLRFLESKLN
ncbi:Dienelactone hydrolase and related enzyme [Methylophaga frappieri]|uniref:Dienelactone hydrolase and related enzyme n=1 Tax=Methylophaga frappieri (strain ATCC BAA-2434 / DSM 25690 / JAM7) TaxID=754477 RepID=I1YL99_METFJ|nr:alpha/beta fold hydrolase [Methylophaga frappieri]AFJ03692.1 Dienelactone hydrolase and related enzyme [Methylophaga frappieri]